MADEHEPTLRPQVSAPQASRPEGTVAPRRSELGPMALTFLFVLLLADAAVETFWSGSPVRWWVVGVAVGYFVLGVLFWRARPSLRERVSWSARASATFFVLLGLIALTAWLPGGLTEGIRMLRQPTAVVLSAISAIGVAFAGIVLLRATPMLPSWVRAALTAIAAYSTAAFLLGALEHTPYAQLLEGRALWARLPRLLQGSMVGTILALPAAMAAASIAGLRRMREAQGMRWGSRQVVALALIITIPISAIRSTADVGPTAADESVAASDTIPRAGDRGVTAVQSVAAHEIAELLRSKVDRSDPSAAMPPQKVIERLEALFAALESVAKEIPVERFDVQVLQARLGRDPIRLYEWVRDETAFVPYRGLLKGSRGVLMEHVGNSVDRAILLYELVRAAGHRARLVSGRLSATASRDLVNATSSDVVTARSRAVGTSNRTPVMVAPALGLSQEVFARQLEDIGSFRKAAVSRIQERVARHVSALRAALGVLPLSEQEQKSVMTAMDHWWVQVEAPSGWLDLDPTRRTQTAGVTLTEVQHAFEPSSYAELPANLFHTIRLRIVVEQQKGQVLRESEVLSHVLRVADLHGMRIGVSHYPMHWPKDVDLLRDANPLERLKAIATAQKEWLPVLSIGTEQIVKSSFTNTGDVNTNPMAPLLGSSPETLGRRIGGLFGRTSSDEAGELTAEWLEYELRPPGAPARKIRRALFDLLGPTGRANLVSARDTLTPHRRLTRALELLSESEILIASSEPSQEFIEHEIITSLLANREQTLQLIASPPRELNEVVERASKLHQIPTRLLAILTARREWGRFHRFTYLDSTNIVSHHRRLELRSDGHLSVLEGFDVVANDVAVAGTPEVDSFLVRLETGVLDTNAEVVLAAIECASEPATNCPNLDNAAEMMETVAREHAEWVVIRTPDDRKLTEGSIAPDAAMFIRQDLAAGYVVLAPSGRPRIGAHARVWWRIDPRTGQALGMGDRGWGQTTGEKVALLTLALTMVSFYTCIGRAIIGGGDQEFTNFVLCNYSFACVIVGFGASFGINPFLGPIVAFICREFQPTIRNMLSS